MTSHPPEPDPTPPDCFRLEELELFQTFENRVLADVNYYRWLQGAEAADHFLFYLELIFEQEPTLLLTSGEDSAAIRIGSAADLVKTARALQALHGQSVIQRLPAANSPLWQPVVGRALEAVRLSKNEQGLYDNDALLLDFGASRILVQLSPDAGLQLTIYD